MLKTSGSRSQKASYTLLVRCRHFLKFDEFPHDFSMTKFDVFWHDFSMVKFDVFYQDLINMVKFDVF